MAKTVITLEENDKGESVVYVEADEKQKGFLKTFADFIVQKARLGDNVKVVKCGPPPVAAPVIQYVDRVVEKVVYKEVASAPRPPPGQVFKKVASKK